MSTGQHSREVSPIGQDVYDKMLEWAENTTVVMEQQLLAVGDEISGEIGLITVGEQELLLKAMKRSPEC